MLLKKHTLIRAATRQQTESEAHILIATVALAWYCRRWEPSTSQRNVKEGSKRSEIDKNVFVVQ